MELEFFELSLSSSEVLSLTDPLLIVSFSQKISVCKASARAIISFFFFSWGFVSTEFSFKLLYYNQRKFLVPLRLGSRFLQVLLIFFELKLTTVARLSAASSCRSVPCTAATSSLEHHLLFLDSKIQQQCIFQVYIVSLSQ